MLLAVRSGTLTVTTLAGFGQSIAQHVSADTDAPYAAVSVFEPGSSRVSPGATVELIDTATGRVVSLARLAGALQVDSLAFGAGVLFAAVSDGMSTEVKRFGVPALVSPGWATGRTTGIPATLETMSLDGAAGVVWATDQTALVCLDASTGRVLSSATSSSSSAAVSGVVASGSGTYAVTSSGIGVLDVPAACGDGAA
jgi:outer membrane protein assembly factor BamB